MFYLLDQTGKLPSTITSTSLHALNLIATELAERVSITNASDRQKYEQQITTFPSCRSDQLPMSSSQQGVTANEAVCSFYLMKLFNNQA